MTKEEILDKHYDGFDLESGWIFDGPVHDVFKAMDEYAKQQAIAFIKWAISQNINPGGVHQPNCWFDNHGELFAESNEHLYTKFAETITQ